MFDCFMWGQLGVRSAYYCRLCSCRRKHYVFVAWSKQLPRISNPLIDCAVLQTQEKASKIIHASQG